MPCGKQPSAFRDAIRQQAKPQKSKLELKREAAAKLERLLVYLDGMAFKDPDTYGKDYNYVVGLVTNLNKTYKRKVRNAKENPDEGERDEGDEEKESPENVDEPNTGGLPKSADSTRVA